MHEDAKKALGIEKSNCETCIHIGDGGDGYEYNGSFPICEKHENYCYLTSFPFKKEMKCWYPEFWYTKFSEMIAEGTDAEMDEAARAYREAKEPFFPAPKD